MADDRMIANATPLVFTPQGSAQNVAARSDNFGNMGVNQVFGKYTELCRNGVLYTASSAATADAGIAGVAALPSTTSGRVLYNAAPASSGICLIPLVLGVGAKSGTIGSGLDIIAGLAGGPLATPLTANDANMTCRNLADGITVDSSSFTGINKTVVQPVYSHFGFGSAATGIGSGCSVDVGGMWIVKPGMVFDVSVLTPAGTAPVFFVSIVYAKIKLDVSSAQ